ncbi:CvfB family protein [Thalassotalea agarivorans]|uniref:GntR family transcriptional regulator n=1 Tax=Thalassotalea agarivorans TaxID=349064 RepID=A0A1H9Y9Y3_THASX|nr:S1-like domain-containing RNA-binding protein [Thalassotalea agarivorans]SES65649.1 hypothetical protein SAMN05660429_00137 [Thalassotalea agarivorans]
MLKIGQYNTLAIVNETPQGLYLDGLDHGEIILPHKEVPADTQNEVSVFVYKDAADRLVATTANAKAVVDDFACLKCIAVNKMGAFLDWGLKKELLVPYNLQHTRMEVGKHYMVKVLLDERTERIVASSKLDKYLHIWAPNYSPFEQVDLTVAAKTDLGFKVIVNNEHWGLLFFSDVFKPLKTGQQLKGFIKEQRDDGRLTITLTRPGRGKVIDFTDTLLKHLEENGGQSPLHDKSSPALIQKVLGVSKKTFKATVGNLLKKGKIELIDHGIRLKKR